jgi:hypothetical protein
MHEYFTVTFVGSFKFVTFAFTFSSFIFKF